MNSFNLEARVFLIEHKKMIEFDNPNQRVANLYYR